MRRYPSRFKLYSAAGMCIFTNSPNNNPFQQPVFLHRTLSYMRQRSTARTTTRKLNLDGMLAKGSRNIEASPSQSTVLAETASISRKRITSGESLWNWNVGKLKKKIKKKVLKQFWYCDVFDSVMRFNWFRAIENGHAFWKKDAQRLNRINYEVEFDEF